MLRKWRCFSLWEFLYYWGDGELSWIYYCLALELRSAPEINPLSVAQSTWHGLCFLLARVGTPSLTGLAVSRGRLLPRETENHTAHSTKKSPIKNSPLLAEDIARAGVNGFAISALHGLEPTALLYAPVSLGTLSGINFGGCRSPASTALPGHHFWCTAEPPDHVPAPSHHSGIELVLGGLDLLFPWLLFCEEVKV